MTPDDAAPPTGERGRALDDPVLAEMFIGADVPGTDDGTPSDAIGTDPGGAVSPGR